MDQYNPNQEKRFPNEFYNYGFKEFYPESNYVSLKMNLMKWLISEKSELKNIVLEYYKIKREDRLPDLPLHRYFFQELLKISNNQELYDEYNQYFISLPLMHVSKSAESFQVLKSLNQRGGSIDSGLHFEDDIYLGRHNYVYFGLGYLHETFLEGFQDIYFFDAKKLVDHSLLVQGLDVFPNSSVRIKNKDKSGMIRFQMLLDHTIYFKDYIELLSLYSVFYNDFLSILINNARSQQVLTEVMVRDQLDVSLAELILKPGNKESRVGLSSFSRSVKSGENQIEIPQILVRAMSNRFLIKPRYSGVQRIGVRACESPYMFLNYKIYKDCRSVQEFLLKLKKEVMKDERFDEMLDYYN